MTIRAILAGASVIAAVTAAAAQRPVPRIQPPMIGPLPESIRPLPADIQRIRQLREILPNAERLALKAIAARERADALDGESPAEILQRLRAIASADRAIQRVIELDDEAEEILWNQYRFRESLRPPPPRPPPPRPPPPSLRD